MNAFLISRDLEYGSLSLSLRITSREGKKKQRRKQRIEFSPVSHSSPTPHPILRAHNKANVIEFRGDDRHTLPFNRSVSIYERTPAKKKKEIIFAILACAKRENSSGGREIYPRRVWRFSRAGRTGAAANLATFHNRYESVQIVIRSRGCVAPIPVGNKTLVYSGRDVSPQNAPF